MGDRSQGSQETLELWRRWRRTGDQAVRNRLVLTLAPMVKQIVFKHRRRLPGHCEVDDFISCGLEALIRSLDRYDDTRGIPLEHYVWVRVHGAVLDESRRQDWAPRSLRAFQRDRDRVVREFTAFHGRVPSTEEVAAALAMTEEELRDLDDRAAFADVHSLNMPIGPLDEDEDLELLDTLRSSDPAYQPEEATLAAELDGVLRDALASLSPRDRQIAQLLYVEELTMREIGDILGVSESRISQLTARIRRSVRVALEREAEPALAA